MSKPNNPPAFPTENEHQSSNSTFHYSGMMLRDYFAAKAMQSQLNFEGMEGCDKGAIAAMSYELADAMLSEREKETK